MIPLDMNNQRIFSGNLYALTTWQCMFNQTHRALYFDENITTKFLICDNFTLDTINLFVPRYIQRYLNKQNYGFTIFTDA